MCNVLIRLAIQVIEETQSLEYIFTHKTPFLTILGYPINYE
jgi:hypothetical protein